MDNYKIYCHSSREYLKLGDHDVVVGSVTEAHAIAQSMSKILGGVWVSIHTTRPQS